MRGFWLYRGLGLGFRAQNFGFRARGTRNRVLGLGLCGLGFRI